MLKWHLFIFPFKRLPIHFTTERTHRSYLGLLVACARLVSFSFVHTLAVTTLFSTPFSPVTDLTNTSQPDRKFLSNPCGSTSLPHYIWTWSDKQIHPEIYMSYTRPQVNVIFPLLSLCLIGIYPNINTHLISRYVLLASWSFIEEK